MSIYDSQHVDRQFKQLLSTILTQGRLKGDRTGTGTYSIFGYQMRFDLSKGFPLATGKKVFTKGMIHELLWLISGSRDNGYLKSHDVHIWDDWDVVPKSWIDLCETLIETDDLVNKYPTLFHKFMEDPVEVDLLKQIKQLTDSIPLSLDERKALMTVEERNLFRDFASPLYMANLSDERVREEEAGILNKMGIVSHRNSIETENFSAKLTATSYDLYLSTSSVSDHTVSELKSAFLADAGLPEEMVNQEMDPAFAAQSLYDNLQLRRYVRLIEFCKENKVDWSTGNLGPVYGEMWRSWPCMDGSTLDQIQQVIHTLRTNPTSRRIIVTAWNPELMPVEGRSHLENILDEKQVLPPCHTLFQFYAETLTQEERNETLSDQQLSDLAEMQREAKMEQWGNEEISRFTDKWLDDNNVPKYRLSCQLYQRSADVPIGLFINTPSYSLLTMMMAQVTNMVPGDFIHTLGDAHIYSNQVEQVKEYLDRVIYELPTVRLNPAIKELTDFTFDDIFIENYQSGTVIKTPVAV